MAVVGSLAFIMLCIFLFYTYLKRRSRLDPTLTESDETERLRESLPQSKTDKDNRNTKKKTSFQLIYELVCC